VLKLSIENNEIALSGIDTLKKYQISQLEYYGYLTKDNLASKVSPGIRSEISKLLVYLKEEEVSVQFTPAADEFIKRMISLKDELNLLFDQGKDIKDGKLDNSDFSVFLNFLQTLPRNLKQHQIKSAYHLYVLKNGANFSVPGSGKTSVVLAVYEKLKRESRCNVLFVIGPPSCFQPWKSEFTETLGREPNSVILSGGSKEFRRSEYQSSIEEKHELYLTTFQSVLHDYEDIIKFILKKGINAFVVIDEAHYMKQIGGSWATALLKISQHATFKCVLTGTPIPKSYKDIYNLFDFLWNEDSPLTEVSKFQIDNFEKNKKDESAKQLLQEKIGPLFYRVRKKDLGLIPAKFHAPIIVKMNEYEQKIYSYAATRILEMSQDDYFNNEEILAKLWRGRMIRLRQAVSYSKLLVSTIEEYDENLLRSSDLANMITSYDEVEVPGKLLKLTDLVTHLHANGQKVLIWSNFIGTLELIKSHFIRLGKKCELIYGKTPVRKEDDSEIGKEKTREDIRDEFIDPDSGLDILIANPGACAESISLHKTCFHAIYYDLSYNCAQFIQSMDRIHRVGGSEIKEANYYFLQYENSIDQDIRKNVETKAQRMYDLIEEDYAIYDLDLYDESLDDDIEAYKRIFLKQRAN
jgi:SNF2 family DNA or RNA helicase